MALVFCALAVLPGGSFAEGKVFYAEDTEPFAPDAKLMTIRVAGMKNGDSMLITCGEESMLVDLGTDSAQEYIRAMLEDAGASGVDYFCNTHPHDDHIGGLMPLAESGFPIGSMITFFPHDYVAPSAPQKLGIRTAQEHQIPIIDAKTGDTMTLGDAKITFYRLPEKKYTWKLSCNDQSAMLRVQFGDCTALLTGDVEIRSQQVLARLYDLNLKADVVKVPHHGASKMDQSFLEKVDPEYAYVTGGALETQDVQKQLKKA